MDRNTVLAMILASGVVVAVCASCSAVMTESVKAKAETARLISQERTKRSESRHEVARDIAEMFRRKPIKDD